MATIDESNSRQAFPIQKTVKLTLTKVLKGTPVLPNPVAVFGYHWNFSTNMGQAILDTLDGTSLNITLYPLGLAGMLAFMSDMKPTSYTIAGKQIIINRVVLDVNPKTFEASAVIMFNQDGSTIQATANWKDDNTLYNEKLQRS